MTEYSKEDIESDLKLLKNQIEITKSEGINLLKKYNGDISKCVLDFYNYHEDTNKNPYKDRDDEDPQKKLFYLRKILDEKDSYFTAMMEKKNK